MNIAVHGRSENAPRIVDALRRGGHNAFHRTDKFFRDSDVEQVNAAFVVESSRKSAIIEAYLRKGIPLYTVDREAVQIPGYPVATLTDQALIDADSWRFVMDPIPSAYTNPEEGRLLCAYYPAAPFDLNNVPPRTKRIMLPDITEFFHAQSLAEAPRVWILAGGPSLRGFDFDLLHGEVVIAVNRSYECPHAGMVVTMDDRFQRWAIAGEAGMDRERWRNFPGIKIYSACESSEPIQDAMVLARRHKDIEAPIPTLENTGAASNSGYSAINIAWAMGAKEIYLLGFDMRGEHGKSAHYHGEYTSAENDSVYEKYRGQLDCAAPRLEKAGIRVTVCGPTALTAFPTITLAEAAGLLSTKPLRPVVCGYYTRGTKYQQEAEAMARSAVAFGLDVSLVDVENLGDWKANTDQKPEAIRFALERHGGAAIAFVDADARFRAYPALFDVFAASDAEIGLSYFDWDAFPGDPRTGRELSTAVMLLKPTKAVLRLLDKWIKAVKAGSTQWEQRVLQDLLSNYAGRTLKTMELPMRYNQIFDSMASLGPPVVEQMQASRRLKSEVAA